MGIPGPENNEPTGIEAATPSDADTAALNEEIQTRKFNPQHPKLFIASEGENMVDGLEINQDCLPLAGTHASRNPG